MKYHAEYHGAEKVYEVIDDKVTIDNRSFSIDPRYYVMPDIQPYQSQIDGSFIQSRSTHRTHLKDNGCIEVGNDWKPPKRGPLESPGDLKRTIIDVFNSKLG